jgi:hypothetical protein
MKNKLAIFLITCLFASTTDAQTALNIADFQTPPQSSKVHTWWHWMDGNITKDGLTKDLEAMKKQGIVQASIFNIGKNYSKEVDVFPKIKFNSPEWIDMYQWALKEANRLGITIGIQTIDGYGTTGGPWITPEFSMKQYVWTKTAVDGGKDVNIKLEQPLVVKNFYRDVAVVAYPLSIKPNFFQNAQPKFEVNKAVSGNGILADGNPKTEINFKKGDVIDIRLDSELRANKLAIFPHLPFCWDDMGKILVQFTVSSSDDGKTYTKIGDVDMVGVNKPITASFPETKAKYFRLELSKTNFMYFSTYPIAEIELLKEGELPTFLPPLTSFLEKVASVFDVKENVHDVNINTPKTAISENSTLDISSFMSADGTLNWKAPKGNWQIIRFGYTSTGVMNDPPTPEGSGLEADKMDTTALSLHFNSYAKKLIDAAGKYKGNTLKFVLLDSWEAEFQTWSKTFPTEFKNRRGYDILSWIPVLCGETMGNTQLSEAFLHDFRKTIAELIDQNYYKHFSNLCHRNGLEFHGEGIYSNWGGYPPLDPLKANQYFDLPMTEFWTENDANGLGIYKPANRPTTSFPTSSALAYDKQIIASESYTNMAHYSEAPADLKPFGDAAYCSGVNQLILHSFVHQPFDKKPGMTLGKFGAHFNRNNPIWAFNQDWLTYQARVQYVLQKGKPVADIVFFAGDQLPQFFSKNFVNDLPFGYQATACNIDMLKNRATVIDGKINFGGKQSYAVLMLQNSSKMEFATLKKIAELVKNGAVVYGPKPLEMLSVSEIKNDETTFKQLADALWGNSMGNNYGKGKVFSGKPIGEVLSQINLIPDLTTNTNNPKDIMYIHRKLDNEDVYFVFNQQNRDINREILFRLKDKTPEIWNPENGTVTRPAIYSIEKNQTRIPVSFKPYESKIFVFKNEVPKQFIPQVSLAGTEIFPNKQLSDTTLMMPQAVFTNGKLTAKSLLTGEYAFKGNDNKVFKQKLAQPEILNLGNSKTKIEFFPISDEIIEPIEVSELTSLTEFENPAIKYFTGKVKYTIDFSVPRNFSTASDSLVLEVGNLGATAEVILNGQLLAHPWHPHTFLNISGLLKAKNTLEITVANECRNRFIGDLVQYGSLKSLWTTSPVETLLNKNMPLKPSGLMSPLRLIGYKKH